MLRKWHRGGARVLGPERYPMVTQALDADPVATCMLAERFERYGLDHQALGGTYWGVAGGSEALAFVGGNLMPVTGTADGLRELADGLLHRRRTVASVVGRQELVLPLWEHLADGWGPARDVRPDQPLMICPQTPRIDPDLRVVPVGIGRADTYFPAAVAMFTEEVGVDPRAGDGGRSYRARVDDLLRRGLAFGILDGDQVIFKAEVGALSRRVALIQGVWVNPAHRGRGLARGAIAAVALKVRTDLGRLPSLYVNHTNQAARRVYADVGFEQVGTFATVLF